MPDIMEIRKDLKDIKNDLTEIKVELAVLKVKSGVWGLLGAALVLVPTLAIYFVMK